MAGNMIANTFATYGDTGSIREDLTDVIWNVSPIETPFCTSIAKARAFQTNHQWQTDSLSAAAANAVVEGDDLSSFDSVAATTKLGNNTQISRKSMIISDTDEAVIHAGFKSTLAYETAKKGRELRRDIEFVLLSNQAKATSAAGTAPLTASVLSWIKTNTSKGAGGADPTTADGTGTRTDGTTRQYTEALVKTVMQTVWQNASDFPDLMLIPGTIKQDSSAFGGNATRFIDADTKKIIASVTVYESDFGDIKLVPDRFLRSSARDVLLLNTELWALAWLRPIHMVDLAKTGDASKRMLVGEYALECRNEAGNAGVFDVFA